MIKKLLTYLAKRSHDVRVQTALAAVYGLISIFGVSKTVLIMVQLNKVGRKKVVRARTSSKV